MVGEQKLHNALTEREDADEKKHVRRETKEQTELGEQEVYSSKPSSHSWLAWRKTRQVLVTARPPRDTYGSCPQ